MLESALENILLQYLAPYVDGITRDKLHLGVFSGSLQLEHLEVRPDALSTLGWGGFRVRRGRIERISLAIPWTKLYTGKVKASVRCLHLEVESLAESAQGKTQDDFVKEMLEAKEKAIAVRMEQLQDLVDKSSDGDEGANDVDRASLGMNLARKILNNITVELEEVHVSFINSSRGLACRVDLPNLAVLSTDRTFRPRDDAEGAVVPGQSMYKTLMLQQLSISMSPAGSNHLEDAEYVLSPVSANLQLAHEPANNILKIKLMVATEELAELFLRRSQVKHLRTLKSDLNEEARKHQLMLVASVAGDEAEQEDINEINKDAEKSIERYTKLYERDATQDCEPSHRLEPLSASERRDMQVLEAVLSARLLARARYKVERRTEVLNEEVARRKKELEMERVAKRSANSGFFSRFWGSSEVEEDAAPEGELLSSEEKSQLLNELKDVSKVEQVDVPKQFSFEFVLGQMALDLIDDRHYGEEHRQLLSVALREAGIKLDLRMATDFLGQDSAEWGVKIDLKSFHALHHTRAFLQLKPTEDSSRAAQWLGDGTSAACFDIQSKLQKEQNLLRISFEFMPVEIYFLEGIAELLLDFWREPVREQAAPLETVKEVDEQLEDVEEWLEKNAEEVKQVAQAAYNRIPDKIELEIMIASPILHVPVSLGTAIFSLGQLHLKTKEPCEYKCIDLDVRLTRTTLRATSLRNEQFDMIQPVPVNVSIEYRALEDKNVVSVHIDAEEEMRLSLAPQALQILLATPTGLMNVMTVKEPETSRSSRRQTFGRWASQVFAAKSDADDELLMQPSKSEVAERRRSSLEDVLGRPQAATSLVEDVTKQMEQVRSKQFIFNLSVMLAAVDMVLADSIVPVLRWRGELTTPLVMYKQKEPNILNLHVKDGSLEVQSLNPNSGIWEPILERFRLGLDVERKAIGEDRDTHVLLSGHEPVLLNVTPSTVKRLKYIMPLFIESVTSSSLVGDAENDHKTGVKYRVVNLFGSSIDLHFRSRYTKNLVASVKPSGSEWKSLDECILPHFATAITAQVHGESTSSEWLSLERTGAVMLRPGAARGRLCKELGGCVAELLSPSPSHKLLFLAAPLRVHNQTDLTLVIRFHDSKRQVLQLDLKSSGCCEASLLGTLGSTYEARSNYTDQGVSSETCGPGELLLEPDCVCSVPSAALVQSREGQLIKSKTFISIRPAGINVHFCPPVEAGANTPTCPVFCRGPECRDAPRRAHIASTSGAHFLCQSTSTTHALPSPTAVTTIAIQPTLAILNAIPLGELGVRYTTLPEGNKFMEATEASVPSFTRWNYYSFPGVQNGLAVLARLDASAPWSQPLKIKQDAFKEEASEMQILQLRQFDKGAPCGVMVEPVSHYELRFACPNWLVDRAGLASEQKLEIQYRGRPLPCLNGLTLLPAECLEESCTFVLSAAWKKSVLEVRMPPNFSVLPWPTHVGDLVYCIQTEDLHAEDMHGAFCQAMVFRPRLVFTNTSDATLQLELAPGRVQSLEAHKSMVHHWPAAAGDEAPDFQLRFRPESTNECGWSGKVICGDETAGCTSFALATGIVAVPKNKGKMESELWSVAISPARGAMAVTFERGSEFIAANRSERMHRMEIRTFALEEQISSFTVYKGEEVRFGWSSPHENRCNEKEEDHSHCIYVTLYVDGCPPKQIKVPDLRRSDHVYEPELRLQLHWGSTAQGALLSVEDKEERRSSSNRPNSTHLEVKISKAGISIIEEIPPPGEKRPRELLFCNLELVRLDWKKDYQDQQLKLAISGAQVDCQLPGRTDARSVRKSDATLGGPGQELPAVILANRGLGDRAFLSLQIKRCVSSSGDYLLPFVNIAMDAVDLTLDDGWLDPLQIWSQQLGDERGRAESRARVAAMTERAGKPVLEGYKPPDLPAVIQVDNFYISKVELTVWCALKLRTVRFLPQWIRTAIGMLSFSGHLTLDGVELKLPERRLERHRGSLLDFLRNLGSMYAVNLLSHAAGLLGKSSVLNLPRVPWRITMTTVSYFSDSVGLISGEASSLLNAMAFDEDYVARQRQIRNAKQIENIHDGLVEAGKSFVDGLEGLTDVFTQPFEGAKQDGLGGFVRGVGRGFAGSVLKPVSKLGEAISDVGSGIASSVSPDGGATKRRRRRCRVRPPRLLFGELGVVRPWSNLEAELKRVLGEAGVHGLEEVLTLKEQGYKKILLCLYPQRLLLVELKLEDEMKSEALSQAAGVTGAAASNAQLDSATSAGHLEEGYDFFTAVDETAVRLFSQMLKPLNTAVSHWDGISNFVAGSSDHDQEVLKRAVKTMVKFSEVLDIEDSQSSSSDMHVKLKLGGGKKLVLPMGHVPPGAVHALVKGLHSASQRGPSCGVANWDDLRVALQDASGAPQPISHLSGGAGRRILEVFEVETFHVVSKTWRTPNWGSMIETETSWRWLDSSGCRHPHLIPGLDKVVIVERRVPPVELDKSLYQPYSPWEVDRNQGDDDGWSYGIAWNTSTWVTTPGPFDLFRRRRWTRTYT
ncbi:unnamed protein product [Durusdinium trenchii]|uniref:Chorein N-terminal domain-containing protein n=1 Tax=Durusdinium trenchii TaxID=1381693 RepID=A0ABP0K6C4_9DINO